MLTVRFYGDMVRRFGRAYTLDVHSPREALHALMIQIPGLRAYFRDHATRMFRVRGPHQDYDASDLHYPLSSGVLKVVPLVGGAGAFGKILAGAALVAVGVISGGALAPAMISIGLSLALSGVSQLIAPRASASATPENAENQPSLAFDGAVNTTGQGGPVPLGYGHVLIGSQIISVGFSTNNEVVVS
ncbi:tail assembly protein [Paraburkholderia terrae]|uniref:Tail assembly protein n=1 Tax=Paraburkholderia terrae TaxID=311230 RepID=A0A2I8ETF1_9BURK|nr:tail assembly protein [Paraburkholderia terrae]AUT62877.1 tail assembly protein [Paraburkholderia terrae]